jgi:DNA-binding transcriptional regulator YiaG
MLYKSKPITEFSNLSEFQQSLKNLRHETGMSCAQMARFLDVGIDTYKSWEYRGAKPGLEMLSYLNLKLKGLI